MLFNSEWFQNRVPEFPAIGDIEDMWHSGHLGDEDWDAEIEALERELEANNVEEKPMELSEDEGFGEVECGPALESGDSEDVPAVDVNNNCVDINNVEEVAAESWIWALTLLEMAK